MDVVCWEVQEYKVYLTDNTEYHFHTEEAALKFIKTYSNMFSYMEKIMRAVVE